MGARLPFALAVLAAAAATPASARAQTLAITGVTIIDGTGNAPLSDGVVLIRDGRIAAVGRSRDVAIPTGARRQDARGKFVIPGLMDANVHLMLNIDLETLVKYEDRYDEIVLEGAQIALKSGLTTVFDTWGPRAALVRARDMINAGQAPGSRIFLAGTIIGFGGPLSVDFDGPAAEHVSKAFAQRINKTWEQGMGRELLSMTPEQVRSVVREYTRKDVDFLKYGASSHATSFTLQNSTIPFSPRVQKVIVEEGHRAGMAVQAHSTSVESLDLAIDAGVDIVTHGENSGWKTPIPEETIRKLVERRVAVSVLPMTQRHLDAREQLKLEAIELGTKGLKLMKANRRNMIEAGVTLLVSTDASIKDPVLAAESKTLAADTVDAWFKLGEGHFTALVALEEEGMDPMEILKSATSHVARAYKLDAKLGTLEPGKIADLIILDANPLESAHNYRRIHAVIKDGKAADRDALPVAPTISTRSMDATDAR